MNKHLQAMTKNRRLHIRKTCRPWEPPKGSLMKTFDWLDRTPYLELGFTLKEIFQCFRDCYNAGQLSLSNMTSTERVQQIWAGRKHEIIRTGTYTFKEYQGGWEREVHRSGYEIRVRNNYFNLYEPKLTRRLFTLRMPWFDRFTWDIYGTQHDIKHFQIYLKVSVVNWYDDAFAKSPRLASLYVNVPALLRGDWDFIENEHIKYHRSYYRIGTPAENADRLQHFRNQCTEVLASPEAQRLKARLKETYGRSDTEKG